MTPFIQKHVFEWLSASEVIESGERRIRSSKRRDDPLRPSPKPSTAPSGRRLHGVRSRSAYSANAPTMPPARVRQHRPGDDYPYLGSPSCPSNRNHPPGPHSATDGRVLRRSGSRCELVADHQLGVVSVRHPSRRRLGLCDRQGQPRRRRPSHARRRTPARAPCSRVA